MLVHQAPAIGPVERGSDSLHRERVEPHLEVVERQVGTEAEAHEERAAEVVQAPPGRPSAGERAGRNATNSDGFVDILL